MLHQTWLISSSSPSPYSSSSSASLCKPFLYSSSSSSSSSSPSSPSPSTSHSSQVPNTAAATPTTHMEPFKTVFLQQQQQAAAMGEEGVFVGERGNNTLFGGAAGDCFSVEELLDLREFSDQLDTPHIVDRREVDREKFRAREVKRESSNSSGVTFDLPPPPSVIDLPAHDAEELEWVSMMMDDSLSEVPASCTVLLPMVPVKKEPCEAKLRPTLCALSTECLVPVKARRSKRSRAAFWSLSGSDNNSSSSSSTTSSCSLSSYLFYDLPLVTAAEAPAFLLDDSVDPPAKKQKPRKRGRKPKAKVVNHSSTGTGTVYQYHPVGGSERRCSHCGVSKTPQWRAGPEGAKTLCNACGVRYKSGRLLPEYRPACSPTFVSELHSNSHRKVLEMRRKESTLVEVSAPAVASF